MRESDFLKSQMFELLKYHHLTTKAVELMLEKFIETIDDFI